MIGQHAARGEQKPHAFDKDGRCTLARFWIVLLVGREVCAGREVEAILRGLNERGVDRREPGLEIDDLRIALLSYPRESKIMGRIAKHAGAIAADEETPPTKKEVLGHAKIEWIGTATPRGLMADGPKARRHPVHPEDVPPPFARLCNAGMALETIACDNVNGYAVFLGRILTGSRAHARHRGPALGGSHLRPLR